MHEVSTYFNRIFLHLRSIIEVSIGQCKASTSAKDFLSTQFLATEREERVDVSALQLHNMKFPSGCHRGLILLLCRIH